MRITIPASVILWPVFGAAVLWGGRALTSGRDVTDASAPEPGASLAGVAHDLAPGWTLRVAALLPEEVTALAPVPLHLGVQKGDVYVGTAPRGGLYRFNCILQGQIWTVAEGLGDMYRFGECNVNALTIADMDGDGRHELLASTSQIFPRGRPRLYRWEVDGPSLLHGVTRPDIASSWSHGVGVLERPGRGPSSLFITFCGNGEVVEYRPAATSATDPGFAADALGWKKVGQLPASGEWTQTADVDNDGRTEVCLSTGFAVGKAAILAYASDSPGAELKLVHRVDEGGRFGNVRFLIAPMRDDRVQEMIAWWCTDPNGGECEMIRYRLGPDGVRERAILAQGAADELWPKDGQAVVWDMDRDGRAELWFATSSGNLWRHDPARADRPARILRIEGGFGPIVGAMPPLNAPPCLFLGRGRTVLRLEKTPPIGPDRPVSLATSSGLRKASG